MACLQLLRSLPVALPGCSVAMESFTVAIPLLGDAAVPLEEPVLLQHGSLLRPGAQLLQDVPQEEDARTGEY